jgi:hypothetical protein
MMKRTAPLHRLHTPSNSTIPLSFVNVTPSVSEFHSPISLLLFQQKYRLADSLIVGADYLAAGEGVGAVNEAGEEAGSL